MILQDAQEHIPGELLRYQKGEGKTTNIICGHFCFENNDTHPVIKNLPDVMHIERKDNDHSPWLRTILDFIDFESKAPKPGTRTLIKKLTEVIFIQAIRIYLVKSGEQSTALNLLSDQQISRSIAALHEAPQKKWTLESLARVSGLSRTVYSKRFKAVSGMTPLNYINQLAHGAGP